ncbi:MAG: AI-2E family transporter [candidate division WOR-3 bacterium]
MNRIFIYIAIIILAFFILISKIFSPIWLLVLAIFILWHYHKQLDVKPYFYFSLFLFVCYVIFHYFSILLPFIIGIFFAYIIGPVVDFLERKKLPRLFAILIIVLPLTALVPVIIFLLTINLINELKFLVSKIPEFVNQSRDIVSSIITMLNSVGIDINQDFIVNTITSYIGTIINGLLQTALRIGQGVRGLLLLIYNFVLIPIFTYLLLAKNESISVWLKNLLPLEEQDRYLKFIEKLNMSFSRYLRGQVILMIIVGIIVGFTLWVLGIKYYVVLGIIAAVGNLIPNIGFVLSFIPAFVIGLFTPPALISIFKIMLVYIGEQLLENFIMGPLIIGKASRLNPVVVIIALSLGGAVGGIWGIIFAIPVVIFVREFLNHFFNFNL